jgi:hypothetical protein
MSDGEELIIYLLHNTITVTIQKKLNNSYSNATVQFVTPEYTSIQGALNCI